MASHERECRHDVATAVTWRTLRDATQGCATDPGGVTTEVDSQTEVRCPHHHAKATSSAQSKRRPSEDLLVYTPQSSSTGSGVEILAHALAPEGHVEYSILSCMTVRRSVVNGEVTASTTARLVQRRFREFYALRQALLPIARRTGLPLPELPSRYALAWSRARLGMRRVEPLQEWLGWVASRPELWGTALREFLGLALQQTSRAELVSDRSVRVSEIASIGSDDEASFMRACAAADKLHTVVL